MIRRSLSAVALAGAAALVAGCGSSSGGSSTARPANAQAEFVDALGAVGNASTLTTTVKLATTPQALTALLEKNGATLSTPQATALARAAITVEQQAPAGKKISDIHGLSQGGKLALAVRTGSQQLLQLTDVNRTIYLRADLRSALTLAGKPSLYDTLSSRVASLPTFVQAFVKGSWVSLPNDSAKSLTNLYGGTVPTPSPSAAAGLLSTYKAILSRDVTTTRVSTGPTDHLRLSADGRKLASDLFQAVAGTLPGLSGRTGSLSPQAFPSGKVTLDAYVSGGVLTGLSLDLGQFDRSANVHLPLTVSFARSGSPITAPSGAVPADLSQLGSLQGGLASGTTSS